MHMNRILLLVAIAAITFAIIFFSARPDLLEDLWLWAVGLAGLIVKTVQLVFTGLKRLFSKMPLAKTEKEAIYYERRTAAVDESVG